MATATSMIVHLFWQQRLACAAICNLGLREALNCPMQGKGERHANEHQQFQEPRLLEKVCWIVRITHIFDLICELVGDASKGDHCQEGHHQGSLVHHGDGLWEAPGLELPCCKRRDHHVSSFQQQDSASEYSL